MIPLWHLYNNLHYTIASSDFAFIVCPLLSITLTSSTQCNINCLEIIPKPSETSYPCHPAWNQRLITTPAALLSLGERRSVVLWEYRYGKFFFVLLYFIMKLIIHLTFIPFLILFHAIHHLNSNILQSTAMGRGIMERGRKHYSQA